jgi:hypothetical protein
MGVVKGGGRGLPSPQIFVKNNSKKEQMYKLLILQIKMIYCILNTLGDQ